MNTVSSMTVEAVVIDNDDPKRMGRLRLRSGILRNENAGTGWVEPRFPVFGAAAQLFVIPEIGDAVELELNMSGDGDLSRHMTALFAPRMRWKAGIVRDADEIASVFAGDHYLKRYGLAVPGAGSVVFSREIGEVGIEAKKVRLGTLEGGEKAVLGDTLASWEDDLVGIGGDIATVLSAITAALPVTTPAPTLAAINALILALQGRLAASSASISSHLSNTVTLK